MFKSARIKLTIVYILMVLTITGTFSSFVYINVGRGTKRILDVQRNRLENLYNNQIPGTYIPSRPRENEKNPREISEEALNQMKKNVLYNLITINIAILTIFGAVAYWFAGRTLRPIENMIEKQKKFIADAAHELKTPITAIKTTLEVNQRDENLDMEKSKSLIDSVLEEVDSLTILVNELLKQSRYQEYNPNKKLEEIDLKEVINGVIKKVNSEIETKEIDINNKIEKAHITGNKKSITELLTILIDNAIKFNNKKGSITIKAVPKEKYTQIEISDTGVGIDEEDIPYIFDRFYKADTSRTKSNHNGYGLGLAIAKDIVSNHKGNISVKSKPGEGATFTIKLPH